MAQTTENAITYADFLKTGPDTLAGRYLRKFWQPVARSKDLPPGRAKPIRIMSEDFTLYRGESGEPHVVAFCCAHRGTQLSTGWVEGDELRCFYHGWKYGPDGQCTEQPAEPEPFCSRIKIKSYPTRDYLGLVFAYLGEGEPPEFLRLLDFEESEFPVDPSCLIWPCNYFTQLDNAMDPEHTAIAHFQFNRPITKAVQAQETECGLLVTADLGGGVQKTPSYFTMPNGHEWGGPPRGGKNSWNYARGWRVPIDDYSHLRFGVEIVASHDGEGQQRAQWHEQAIGISNEVAQAILGGERDSRDMSLEQFPGPIMTNIQDYTILVGLGPIADHPNPERLGQSDRGVILLRQIWARELHALAEGRPLTQWHRPEHLWKDIETYAAAAR